MLIAQEVYKSYLQCVILNKISLSISTGEMVAIMGSSGAGKTTLLHLLSTLDKPDKGSIIIDGINILKLKPCAVAAFRNKEIGFIFQFHNLMPELTLFENICLPGYIAGRPKSEVEQKANELIALLEIYHRKDYLPAYVSGGQKQRAAIARALINNPSIIFADEPSGNLDAENTEILRNLFLDLRQRFHNTFILVTHNPSFAAIADRILLLHNGLLQPS